MIDYLNIMSLFPPEGVGRKLLSKVTKKNIVLSDLRIWYIIKHSTITVLVNSI